MAIRAVFCDFGGVLYKTPDYRWALRIAQRLGMKLDDLIWGLYLSPTDSPFVKSVLSGQVPEAQVWQDLSNRLRLRPGVLNRMRANSYAQRRLNRPMIALLKGLRPRYKTAILTNAATDFRSTFCAAFDMEAWVDRVIISAELGMAKPEPEIFLRAAELMGVSPREALMIDDVAENVIGARQAGLRGIHFLNKRQAEPEILKILCE